VITLISAEIFCNHNTFSHKSFPIIIPTTTSIRFSVTLVTLLVSLLVGLLSAPELMGAELLIIFVLIVWLWRISWGFSQEIEDKQTEGKKEEGLRGW